MKRIVLGLALASALALPSMVLAQDMSEPMPKPAHPAKDHNLSGKITDKSSTAITVGAQTVSVNTATEFTKGGEKITLNDLKIGDKVSISTIQAEDGRLLAVTVEVTSAA